MPRVRRVVYTLNNPQYDPVDKRPDYVTFVINQLEQGEQGTQHYQGYAEFNRAVTFQTIKKWIPRAHLEKARGSQYECIKYCSKEETRLQEPTTYGTPKQQGRRTDILEFRDMIYDGSNNYELNDTHPHMVIRYPKYISFCRSAILAHKPKPVPKVYYLQGPAGTGKSKSAFACYSGVDRYRVFSTKPAWFDGYIGQPIVIFDDFHGSMEFDLLLQVIDRYPIVVPIKGGSVPFVPEIIIFTSTTELEQLYPVLRRAQFDELSRRITRVITDASYDLPDHTFIT